MLNGGDLLPFNAGVLPLVVVAGDKTMLLLCEGETNLSVLCECSFLAGRLVTLKLGAGVRFLIGMGEICGGSSASEDEDDSDDEGAEFGESIGESSPLREIRRTPAPSMLKGRIWSVREETRDGK